MKLMNRMMLSLKERAACKIDYVCLLRDQGGWVKSSAAVNSKRTLELT